MNGQWIGTYAGTNSGTLVVELDDVGGGYEGSVIAVNHDLAPPSVAGEFLAPKDKKEFQVRIFLASVERSTGEPFSEDVFKSKFDGITQARYADAAWKIGDRQIDLRWSTDIGTNGIGNVKRSASCERSKLITAEMNWDQFKAYATSLEPARFVFRGRE
jgi:hypothetical protein